MTTVDNSPSSSALVASSSQLAGYTPSTPAPSVSPAHEPLLKRPLDWLLASVMLIAALPVTLFIVLAIKLEDGGPVFFFQERWGRGGKRFWAYKFRTMVPNADKIYGIRAATHNDPRITRVGRVLRAMGLDELPQIINIWRGEMSFVGPRALAVGEQVRAPDGTYMPYDHVMGFFERLAARPGLTSLATIHIPKDSPPRKKFRYDMLYIRRMSFWLDVQLILLSFWISFRGKWESRQKKL